MRGRAHKSADIDPNEKSLYCKTRTRKIIHPQVLIVLAVAVDIINMEFRVINMIIYCSELF